MKAIRIVLLLVFGLGVAVRAEDTSIQSKDINTNIAGSTTPVGEDGFDVVAAGRDIWFQNDSFRFVYCQLDGDFDVRVRVLELKATHDWAKAGLMVRTALTPDAAQVSVILAGKRLTQVMQRSEKGEMVTGRQQSESFEGVVLRLVRKGGAVTAYRANTLDSAKFEKISDALAMPTGPLFVGMCVCSHSEPEKTSAKFREFVMVGVGSGKDPLAGLAEKEPATPASASRERRPSTVSAAPALPPQDESPIARPAGPRKPVDAATATALALAGAQMVDGGKIEQAREYFYKSLANDPNCGEALYELGKLFEKDGNTVAAGNFFAQASRELMRVEEKSPAAAIKRKDADRRVLALNPAAAQLRQALQDYSDDLGTITRRLNDTLTHDEVADRIQTLQLERYVGAERLPKTPNRTVTAVKTSTVDEDGYTRTSTTALSPDIEKALKAAGWQTITGKWKKVSENVYEVSNGKLEAKFKNGVMQAVLVNAPTSKGSVSMLARNSHGGIYSSMYTYRSGYGLSIDATEAKSHIPYGLLGGRFTPMEDKAFKLDSPQKNQFMISAQGGALEYHVNGKRVHRSNYAISDEGPFVIEITGTATIQMPQVKGSN